MTLHDPSTSFPVILITLWPSGKGLHNELENHIFFMGKLTISMAYVKLPDGILARGILFLVPFLLSSFTPSFFFLLLLPSSSFLLPFHLCRACQCSSFSHHPIIYWGYGISNKHSIRFGDVQNPSKSFNIDTCRLDCSSVQINV